MAKARRLPRGRCPECGARTALRKTGELREHPDHRHEYYGVPGAVRCGRVPTCPGSGAQPKELLR